MVDLDWGAGVVDKMSIHACGDPVGGLAWINFAANGTGTLTAGDGSKTLCAHFKDLAGMVSSEYSDSIILDRTAPSNPTSLTSSSHTVGQWSADDTITVSWSGAAPARSPQRRSPWPPRPGPRRKPPWPARNAASRSRPTPASARSAARRCS